jgi:hypothetical protein
MNKVRVVDFTELPGARKKDDGNGSAEEFFDSFVKPKLEMGNDDGLVIDFDGTWGYASSFVSELARRLNLYFGGKDFSKAGITLISNDDSTLIERFRKDYEKTY